MRRTCHYDAFEGTQEILEDLYDGFVSSMPVDFKRIKVMDPEEEQEVKEEMVKLD